MSDKIKKILDDIKKDINIKRTSNVLFDGRQFAIKIPKEVSNFFKLAKGDKLEWEVNLTDLKNPKTNIKVIKGNKK